MEDKVAEDLEQGRKLDKGLSSQDPDRVDDYNRRVDRRRAGYVKGNYDGSKTELGE
ncbi:MAG TPA: hypothetical protein VK436_16855 [Methanocella sp.]|nr:hypothetical protein [Methanocella sp.]